MTNFDVLQISMCDMYNSIMMNGFSQPAELIRISVVTLAATITTGQCKQNCMDNHGFADLFACSANRQTTLKNVHGPDPLNAPCQPHDLLELPENPDDTHRSLVREWEQHEQLRTRTAGRLPEAEQKFNPLRFLRIGRPKTLRGVKNE